ncbi:integrase catalytic domain-containing protein [Trichonephila clavipes]|nr:integrase catalytic domain-containing protein [Trichonephila clavipes]
MNFNRRNALDIQELYHRLTLAGGGRRNTSFHFEPLLPRYARHEKTIDFVTYKLITRSPELLDPNKLEIRGINLDKIAEDYCEIETFESLEIIQLDIEDINQRIETTEVGLKLLMYSLKNSENVNINLNDNGKNSIRLPQIPLPEFSGVIAEFSNFKNQFINLISNNEQLNDSQKLYYLRASLKGEAKLLSRLAIVSILSFSIRRSLRKQTAVDRFSCP